MGTMDVDPEDERTDCDGCHGCVPGRLMGTMEVGLEDERIHFDGDLLEAVSCWLVICLR